MGRIFIEHPNGTIIYHCKKCDIPLANSKSLTSTSFTGATGPAFLFRKVCNIKQSDVQKRLMITGMHFVRDVYCKNCSERLGWMYEMAMDKKQEYKERQTILERALIYQMTDTNKIYNNQDDSSDSDIE